MMPAYSSTQQIPLGFGRVRAFTLVEMLVVVSIIGILVALLLPALGTAREYARSAQCQNNLRQFGTLMLSHAERNGDQLCSGAFSWSRDGAVTEIGWVADMVKAGAIPGKQLCPSNLSRLSDAYADLLSANTGGFAADTCVNKLGPPAEAMPDGSLRPNACRRIVEAGWGPNDPARVSFVQTEILDKGFNTNYIATWYLVRGGPVLTSSGNFSLNQAGCGTAGPLNRHSTAGPLRLAMLDTSLASASAVPLLGDAAQNNAAVISAVIGDSSGVAPTLAMTNGPVMIADLSVPSFGMGTTREGPMGWWKVWDQEVLQDYRGFAAFHRGGVNVLFADGGVRSVVDKNGDGMINNGFGAIGGYGSGNPDVKPADLFGKSALDMRRI